MEHLIDNEINGVDCRPFSYGQRVIVRVPMHDDRVGVLVGAYDKTFGVVLQYGAENQIPKEQVFSL